MVHVGHVRIGFALVMSISCFLFWLGTQRECGFWWNITSTCEYVPADCRSEPPLWVELAGTFYLSAEAPVTKMASPAAYLINDKEEARFQVREIYNSVPKR